MISSVTLKILQLYPFEKQDAYGSFAFGDPQNSRKSHLNSLKVTISNTIIVKQPPLFKMGKLYNIK